MVLLGLSFMTVTLAANLFHVGPAFDRLTDGFRPVLTQSAIRADQQDLARLSAAGAEIQTKLLPALGQQLNLTPAQMTTLLSTQYPDVARGLSALPQITPTFTGLVTTLDQQRPLFRSAERNPDEEPSSRHGAVGTTRSRNHLHRLRYLCLARAARVRRDSHGAGRTAHRQPADPGHAAQGV